MAVMNSELHRLERELDELLNGLTLRPTLERAIAVGNVLLGIKKVVPHGEWTTWLAKRGLRQRTAQDYMQVAKEAKTRDAAFLPQTLHGFLMFIRKAKQAGRKAELHDARLKAAIAAER